MDGKCQHGAECVFGAHDGHPKNVTPQMKVVCEARRKTRLAKKEAKKAFDAQRKEYAAIKRRLDLGEQV